MQRTLKREFEELEVVEREAIAASKGCWHCMDIPTMSESQVSWFCLLGDHV
jgi:hypothetical protein